MALLKKDENLFDESSMSFGEHLEELRTCLWYCIIWILGGFLVGLFFGGGVVRHIQKPLNDALMKYYVDQSARLMEKESVALQEQGYPDWIASIPKKRNMVPEHFYVFPGQLDMFIQSETLILDPLGERNRRPFSSRRVDNLIIQKNRILENGGTLDDPGADDGDGISTSLEKVDNLSLQKQRLRDKGTIFETNPELKKMVREKVDFSDEPQLLVLFRKIETDKRLKSQALNFHESFSIYIKASLLVGVIFASPGIFYHLWSFVASGLYFQERKYVYVFMPISIGLFLTGTALAFYFVFAYVLDFLLMFNDWLDIDPAPRINEWISFAILLPVGFGVSFQLPLVMFVLERIGIFTIGAYLANWKIAVMLIFVLSMFLTPADPWSLLLMAIPLTFLYFGGILMCKFFPRRESEFVY